MEDHSHECGTRHGTSYIRGPAINHPEIPLKVGLVG